MAVPAGMRLTVEDAVARVRARNHAVRAVLRPMLAGALADAERLDHAGAGRGPLHRVPYVLKDTWDTAGVPTTAGSWRYRDRVPATSSEVHRAFEAAGAVLLGKSNVPDLACTPECDNNLFGPTSNPHDTTRTSGGSTGGGAAAVADGMAAFDWGTDFGGSIRLPAAFCGVVGLRLSPSTWPLTGHFPEASNLGLASMGPLAATVAECRAVLDAVAARLRRGPEAAFSPTGAVVLVPDDFSVGEWPRFGEDAAALLARIGLPVVTAAFPSPHAIDRAFASFVGSHFEQVYLRTPGTALAALARLAFGRVFDPPELHRHSAEIIGKLALARVSVYRSRKDALRRMDEVRAAARAVFERELVLVAPTTTFPAPLHGGAIHARGIGAFVKLGNVIDATAIAVPFGTFANGLPRSLQILAPPGAERAVLALAERIEGALQP